MKKRILAPMLLIFIGCGGGSSSTNSAFSIVNNATLNDGKNQYGYYGKSVKWGNHTLARRWDSYVDGKVDSSTIFSTGEEGYVVNGTTIDSITYGVSKDGRTVNLIVESVHLRATLKNVLDKNCYTIYTERLDTGDSVISKVCAEE